MVVNKGLAVLLMSATAGGVPTGHYGPLSHWYGSSSKVVGKVGVDSPSSSRPDRMPGEKYVPGATKLSSGSFGVGEFSALAVRGGSDFTADLLLGAALFMQTAQTSLDHEIQAIVAQKFEAYWD